MLISCNIHEIKYHEKCNEILKKSSSLLHYLIKLDSMYFVFSFRDTQCVTFQYKYWKPFTIGEIALGEHFRPFFTGSV